MKPSNIFISILAGVALLLPFQNAFAGKGCPSKCTHTKCSQDKIVVPYISFGGTGIDVDDMNSLLTSKGYRRFKDYSFLLGGGFYKKFGRSIIEAEIRGVQWNTRKSGNKKSALKGINGMINYGFNVLPEGNMILFPFVGGGLGKLWLDLTQTSATFDAVLLDPPTELTLTQRTFILQSGIGFDYTLNRKKGKRGKPTIGIRAGYTFDPTDRNDWYDDKVEIKGGPKISMNGPFVRIILGKAIQKGWHKGKDKGDKI